MKTTLTKIDILIEICQQIYLLLKAPPDALKAHPEVQTKYISLQQVADKCRVSHRQARRWVTKNILKPVAYFGSAPYFDCAQVEEAMNSGVLKRRGN